MKDTQTTTNSSTGHEQMTSDPSPSAGWRETAAAIEAPNAHDVEPVDAVGCGALGCHADDPLFQVPTDDGRRVLCPDHAADVLDSEVNA